MSDSEEPSEPATQDIAEIVDPLAGLKPRQRRLAQMLAEGKSNKLIQEELGYCASRISILQNNHLIRTEVARLQDKIFEASIETRLKEFNNAALDHVEFVLKDRTHRVKVTEKNDIAKWVIEMQKSKAPQMHDVGQNMLSVLLDRLDAKKTERKVLPARAEENDTLPVIELAAGPQAAPENAPKDTQKDELAQWVEDFCGESGQKP
jgi:DNA-binding CsgD family transcriptional regulator